MDVGNVKDAAQVKLEGKLSPLSELTKLMNSIPRPLRSPAVMYPNHHSKHPRNPNSLERVSLLFSLRDPKLKYRTSKVAFVNKDTDSIHKSLSIAHIFRTDPLPIAPISFSSIVSQPPPIKKVHTKTGSSSTSSSENDLEVTLDWEEIPKASDDWTEARKKQHKKPVSERRERGGRRALAGTVPDANGSGKGKRGGRKRDNGVRDMKPRPCHTYYLSKFTFSPLRLS
jgi:hypothetical protein